MKTTHRISPIAILTLALLLCLLLSTNASAPLPKDGASQGVERAAPTEPYDLTLSLDSVNNSSYYAPLIVLKVTNHTQQHTLSFLWAYIRDATFEVEYRSSPKDSKTASDWKPLKPNTVSSPNGNQATPSDVLRDTYDVTYSHHYFILPGREGDITLTPDFPMSKQGFYRVRAIMKVRDAVEVDTSVTPPIPIREFELVLHSQPFVVRRTADGFVPVDVTTGKQAPSK